MGLFGSCCCNNINGCCCCNNINGCGFFYYYYYYYCYYGGRNCYCRYDWCCRNCD